MCLSTVYDRSDGQRTQIAKNVASVQTQDGKLVFTDIMGVNTVVDAEIVSVDLMDNYIDVRRRQS